MSYNYSKPSEVAPRYREYLRLWKEAGHKNIPDIGYWILVYVDETDAKAMAKAKPQFEYCFTKVFASILPKMQEVHLPS